MAQLHSRGKGVRTIPAALVAMATAADGPKRRASESFVIAHTDRKVLSLLQTRAAGGVRRSARATRRCLLMSGADPFNEVKGEVEAAVSQLAANKSWPAGRVQEAVEQIEFDLGMLDESIERRASTRDRARILTRHP